FEVKAKLKSLAGHLATRQKALSLYGKVNIDGGQSKVSVAAVDATQFGPGQAGYKITIVPKDRFGNYLGPGYSSLVKLSSTQGNFQPVHDNNDGTYTAVLIADAKRKVRITAKVDGVAFPHRPVASPEGPPARSGASLHLGLAFPLEALGEERKAGLNVMADFEYLLRPQLSLRAYIGYNSFPAESPLTDDASIININTNLRYSRQLGGFSIFGEAGPGYYSIENSDSRLGLNVGCGIWFPLSLRWGVELAAHYHSIFTSPDRTVYFHLAGGFTLRL
ncbi:MAG TPA: Ig-like domain-containing protein, partial [Acidobacteriota bacterium]